MAEQTQGNVDQVLCYHKNTKEAVNKAIEYLRQFVDEYERIEKIEDPLERYREQIGSQVFSFMFRARSHFAIAEKMLILEHRKLAYEVEKLQEVNSVPVIGEADEQDISERS